MSPDPKGTERRSIGVEVQIQPGLDDLSRAAASEFVRQGRRAVQEKGQFSVALSGGSTPKSLYSLLVNNSSLRKEVPWDQTHFFWGDERHVPPDHPESNYRMTKEAMLSKIAIPSENIHRIRAENPNAQQAAEEYEETVRTFFRLKAGEFRGSISCSLAWGRTGIPRLSSRERRHFVNRERLVVANWVEKFHAHRITITLPVLNQAAFVLFLVSGEDKAETLRQVLEERGQKPPFPSQLVRPTQGRLLWLVDRGAGRLLKENAKARHDRKKKKGA